MHRANQITNQINFTSIPLAIFPYVYWGINQPINLLKFDLKWIFNHIWMVVVNSMNEQHSLVYCSFTVLCFQFPSIIPYAFFLSTKKILIRLRFELSTSNEENTSSVDLKRRQQILFSMFSFTFMNEIECYLLVFDLNRYNHSYWVAIFLLLLFFRIWHDRRNKL